jgi:hypothetical protein
MKHVVSRSASVIGVVSILALSGPSAHAQIAGKPLRMSAWALSTSNTLTGRNNIVDIRVDEWSTPAEREQLIGIFIEKGQAGLLKALERVPVKGRIRTPYRTTADPHDTFLGWDLRFASQTVAPDGSQRILIATDRVLSMNELVNQSETIDYPFTFIEIRLDKFGKGEGKMAIATQMKYDKPTNTIIYEIYSSEPARLNEVRVVD